MPLDLLRQPMVGAMVAAINQRGSPPFNMSQGVTPVLELMSMDDSAFPAHVPFFVETFISAQVALKGYACVGLRLSAPSDMRLLINSVELYHNDAATTTMPQGVVGRAQPLQVEPSGVLVGSDAASDPSDYIKSGNGGTINRKIGETIWDAGALADPFLGYVPTANPFSQLQGAYAQRDTQIILRPGQNWIVTTLNTNIAFAARLRGRVYPA